MGNLFSFSPAAILCPPIAAAFFPPPRYNFNIFLKKEESVKYREN